METVQQDVHDRRRIKQFLVGGSLLIIFMLGLILRIGALANTELIEPIRGDASKYLSYAHNLTHSGVYSGQHPAVRRNQAVEPDAVVAPGYPVFISLFLDKEKPTTMTQVGYVLQFQMFLSACCVLMIFFAFLPLVGQIPSLGIALLTAISPHLVNSSVYLLTESFFGFLFVAWLLLFTNIVKDQSLKLLFMSGLLLAAAALTRSWIQYFVLLMLPVLIWGSRQVFNQKGMSRAFLAGFMAIFSIWIGRNLLVLGTTGDSTLMLATLQHGMYPDMMFRSNPASLGVPYRFDPQTSQLTSSLLDFITILWDRIVMEPWTYIQWYLGGKAATVLSWNIIAGVGDIFIFPLTSSPYLEPLNKAIYAEHVINQADYSQHLKNLPLLDEGLFGWTHLFMRWLHTPLTWLAVMGALLAWWPKMVLSLRPEVRWVMRVLSLLFIYFLIIHSVAAPFPRYSIPIRPLVYGLAIFALVIGREKLQMLMARSS